MSVTPMKLLAKYFVPKWNSFCFPVLALAVCASSASAQAPAVVFDAQQTLGYGYFGPQSIAVSSNGTVFIADTGNNQIISLNTGSLPNPSSNNVVATGTFVLNQPDALALDAHGNLYVGDAPTTPTAGGRIIELYGDGNGNLIGATNPAGAANPTPIVAPGTGLINPIALTFDNTGTLFIGDNSTNGAIYSLAAGSSTPQLLTFSGAFPTQFAPAALLRDSSNNLYIADNGVGSGTGNIYKAPATGGAATVIATQQFLVQQPSGLLLNAAGDLYVLTFLGPGQNFNPGAQVLIIPAASPATPYILPNNGIASGSGMAFDPNGNLDVLDFASGKANTGAALQLSTPNPVKLGNVNVGQAGFAVLFNFEFNTAVNLRGFKLLTEGDVSTEISQAGGGNCVLGNHTTIVGPGNPTISAYYPYNCLAYFSATPTFPGIRNGAIQVRGTGASILASVPVWQTAFAGAEVTYPMTASMTATGLQQPQAIAISGLNKSVYVADTLAGQVLAYKGLNGKTGTPVNTGSFVLSSPSALALDGAGDLYIADFDNADVIKVPMTTGLPPSLVNTGGLLQHPLSLAIDFLGNMYIGDAGPGGISAGAGNPGYLVKVPVGGAAFKMTPPSSFSVIFPQALATDPYTADLLIGDGGDPSGVGFVAKIFSDGSGGGSGPVNGVTDPSGLAFDQADNLYILDGTANTITAVAGPQLPGDAYLVQFDNSTLSAASALAISAGGQSFIVASIGSGSSNSLLHLNGNASMLNFGTVNVGTASPAQTATVYNIGNLDLTLKTPYFSTSGFNAAFSVLPSSTCANGLVLPPSIPCAMNIQFKPQSLGATSQTITVESDGYNGTTNNPVLTVRGTGGGFVAPPGKKKKR